MATLLERLISIDGTHRYTNGHFTVAVATAILTIFILVSNHQVNGHGRLIEPPSRASAWRYGFNTPPNYNDHELYCGGFTRQWSKNGGKCGVCGDAWDQKPPRSHEFGGKYGQGVIVRKYPTGSVITIRVEITANHNGFFEFAICPDYASATQECLDKNLLKLVKQQDNVPGNIHRYYPNEGNRVYEMRYRLPKNLECEHCLLQWRYIAGNNWGSCPNGTSMVGCGPQEQFRSCSDITILKDISSGPSLPTRKPPTVTKPPTHITSVSTTTESDVPDVPSYLDIFDNYWIGLIISLMTFLVVSVLILMVYIYYYHGKVLKDWLRRKRVGNSNCYGENVRPPTLISTLAVLTNKPEVPVKPPRTKKLSQREQV